MKTTWRYLLEVLTGPTVDLVPKLKNAMNRFPGGDNDRGRAAAALTAIAVWESDLDTEAVGDNGQSLGLWQVNIPTWKTKLGGEKKARELASGAIGEQLEAIAPVMANAVSKMTRAQENGYRFDGARAAVHLSIIWQYGGSRYSQWIASGTGKADPTGGFKTFSAATDRPVLPDYDKRQSMIEDDYLEFVDKNFTQTDGPGPVETAFDYWMNRVGGGNKARGRGILLLVGLGVGAAAWWWITKR